MRLMFTSPRLENVESVAKLFNDAGITTKITEGRSYKGYSRRQFSYNEKNLDSSQQPAVWVLKAEHYRKARDILHEGGLLETTRNDPAVSTNLQFRNANAPDSKKRLMGIRLILLALIGSAIALLRLTLG